jgi:hypothetical protein
VSKLLVPSSLFKPVNHIRACILHGPNAAIQVEKNLENFMVALGLGTYMSSQNIKDSKLRNLAN